MAPWAKDVRGTRKRLFTVLLSAGVLFQAKKDSALSTTTDKGYLSTKVIFPRTRNGIENFSISPHTYAAAKYF